jgi:Fe-S cluster assembly protein SufD
MSMNMYRLPDPVVASELFNRNAVVALSELRYEPEWIRQKRMLAWSLFGQTPMPSSKDDHWRRTDMRSLEWRNLEMPALSSDSGMRDDAVLDAADILKEASVGATDIAGTLGLVNGRAVVSELDDGLRQQGVVFTDLLSAVREYPELVREYFMTKVVLPGSSKFTAQHSAFWDNGVFLYVPKGVEIKRPFHVLTAMKGDNTALFPHTLVVAEPYAKLSLVEEFLSLDGGVQSLNNGVVEIAVSDGAQVTYVDLQEWGRHVFSFNTRRAVLQPDSSVTWQTAQLGGRMAKTFVDTLLIGNGSTSRFDGVYLANDEQQHDLDTLTHHFGLGTTGDLLVKGAAADKARAVFQGMIKIAPGAQQTDSYLKNDNLLLSRDARIDTIPGLEIDANDVRASHGATVSRTDEDQVFYLQTRGIRRQAAIRQIVEGFFASVYDRIEFGWMREKMAAAVADKLAD